MVARPKVLLVEDDFILRAHVAELLMLEGEDVVSIADGAEALSRLLRDRVRIPAIMITETRAS